MMSIFELFLFASHFLSSEAMEVSNLQLYLEDLTRFPNSAISRELPLRMK